MRTKTIKIGIIVISILILVLVGYFMLASNSETSIQLETLKVKKGNVIKIVTATGTVEPLIQVEVGTQVSGEVEKIYVDYNSLVKKGDLLAELDKTNLKSTLLQAQALYNTAVNDKNYLQNIYNRQKMLFENKVLSQSDYDEALYNLNNAKNTVQQKASDLKSAQTNLSYATIYSPIDGVVLSKEIDEGQTVAANFETPTLFTIAKDLKEMQVEAAVDEADIGEVKEGQRVMFTVDAYQGIEFEGKVTQVRLNPTEESNVITYTVVIKAENPEMKLKPGLTATVYIYTLELKDVLTIEAKAANFTPNQALLKQYELQYGLDSSTIKKATNDKLVWLLTNKAIVPQEVKLGESDGVNIQVISGLIEDEELIYNLKSIGKSEMVKNKDNESPFMPKPPGKK